MDSIFNNIWEYLYFILNIQTSDIPQLYSICKQYKLNYLIIAMEIMKVLLQQIIFKY